MKVKSLTHSPIDYATYCLGLDTDGKVKLFRLDGGPRVGTVGRDEWVQVQDYLNSELGNMLAVTISRFENR